MTVIRTSRLTLRPFVSSDAPAIARLIGDPRVANMLADVALPFDQRQAELWLQPAWGDTRLAIEHDGAVLGGVSYHAYTLGYAGIGYWLGPAFWGRGIASEAAEAVVRFGFGVDRVQSFLSAHFLDNPASGRVLARLGFEAYGAQRYVWCPARKAKVLSANYHLPRGKAGFAPASRTWAGWLGFHPWRSGKLAAGSTPLSRPNRSIDSVG